MTRYPSPPPQLTTGGPIGVLNVGLTPLTHRTAVVMPQGAVDIEIRFRTTQKDLRFSHTLTSWGWKTEQLQIYSMQREFEDEIVFVVTPPMVGRYGLHIFAQYPGMNTHVHICSYLLLCTAVKPVVPPIPQLLRGDRWGPTMACGSLGMSAFTHPDPFIPTSDDSAQIIMALVMNICVKHELIYYGSQEPFNATSHVSPQTDGQSITYRLPLQNIGYYRFTIMGKEASDPDIPVTTMFHYLIKKL